MKTCHNVLKCGPKLVPFVLVCYASKLLLKVAPSQEPGWGDAKFSAQLLWQGQLREATMNPEESLGLDQ